MVNEKPVLGDCDRDGPGIRHGHFMEVLGQGVVAGDIDVTC